MQPRALWLYVCSAVVEKEDQANVLALLFLWPCTAVFDLLPNFLER